MATKLNNCKSSGQDKRFKKRSKTKNQDVEIPSKCDKIKDSVIKDVKPIRTEKVRTEKPRPIKKKRTDFNDKVVDTDPQFIVSVEKKKELIGAVDVKINDFSISAHGKNLFDRATLKITKGNKYGLIGKNGSGKTTLLKHISSRALNIPKSINILYCEQEIDPVETTALDVVLNSDIIRTDLLKRVQELEQDLERDLERDLDELNSLYEKLDSISADSAPSRAHKILAGLGFTKEMMNRPTKDFSGGWRMRISLARCLFLEPELLLLDEPTNHLDLNAVIWLDNYLMAWKKTLLIVSHDKSFLDNVCTDIIHLDQLQLWYYKGNYTTFEKMRIQKNRTQLNAYDKQAKEISMAKSSGKSVKQAEKTQLERVQRKTKQDQRDEPIKLIKKPQDYVVSFTFPDPPVVKSQIIGLDNVSFGYPDRDLLLKNLEFGIDQTSRVAIVGLNGVGKSTILKLLNDDLQPKSGSRIKAHRTKVGKYSQHSYDQLNLDITAVEYIGTKHNLGYQDSREMLGKFGLPSFTHELTIKHLSGGQKSRVALADMTCNNCDVIILDEPTNNLDIESIEALIYAINKFKGGVIIVSHDEHFIRETKCQLWVVENKGLIEIDGDFDDYRTEVLEFLAK